MNTMRASGAAAILSVVMATTAMAQAVPDTAIPSPNSTTPAHCSPVEREITKLQLDALRGMRSSVGQTAKDFCTALSKTEDDATKRGKDLVSDVLALIKKHAGVDVDIKSISKMCMANQDVPAKALDDQIKALERAALACQDPV
jgi:hypothetical protein